MYKNKIDYLINWFKEKEEVAIAFSGGIDSTLLAKIGFDALANKAYALTGVSSTLAGSELNDAKEIAAWIGIEHIKIETFEMEREDFVKNDQERCFYCKKELFKKCKEWAERHGVKYVAEGTNSDDLKGHRPGYKAGKDFNVVSPYIDLNINKEDIRIMARILRIPNWNKPALACLSSRIPYGMEINQGNIDLVEKSEKYLRAIGLKQFRSRYHGDLLRIEVANEEMNMFNDISFRENVYVQLKSLGFEYITVDLKPFRGEKNLNKLININIDDFKEIYQ